MNARRISVALIAFALVPLASSAEPLTIREQGSFFVGGEKKTVATPALGAIPAQTGDITVNQMYVQYQIPMKGERARSGRHGPRLLLEQQNVGDDAGWPHGLERVLRAQGSPGLSRGPGITRALGIRPDGVRQGPSGRVAAGPAAEHSVREPPDRVDGVPLRPQVRRSVPRPAVPDGSDGRALQADDPRSQLHAAARQQSHLATNGGARQAARRRDLDGSLGIGLLPGAGRADRSLGNQGHRLDRDALRDGLVSRANRDARENSDAGHLRRSLGRRDRRSRELGSSPSRPATRSSSSSRKPAATPR